MYANIATAYAEAFVSPTDRMYATHELASHGAEALPVIQSILDGSLTNQWGIPYRALGTPVDCALVTVTLLGPTATPLIALVQAEIDAGHQYATEAMRAIKSSN